ncbi:MAG: hypothetical protein KC731_14880 [Myxococcales bacterium]|nr:hypothetical protein [Myxococcales bacterium]
MNKEGSFTIFVGAALAIAGFFFGWFGLSYSGVSFSLSGWELTKLAKQNGVAYYLVYLLPLGAAVAGAFAVHDRRRAARVATVVGGLFLLWGVVEVARILYRTTFLGLWLTLAGVLMLFVGGLAGLGRR